MHGAFLFALAEVGKVSQTPQINLIYTAVRKTVNFSDTERKSYKCYCNIWFTSTCLFNVQNNNFFC